METAPGGQPWLGRYCPPAQLQSRLSPGQWCAFGVPVSYDYHDATRGGMGPALIRKSLPFLWPGFPRLLWDWNAGGVVQTVSQLPIDLGDIPYNRRADRAADVEARITELTATIAALGGRPLVLGGEHWITYPVLRGLVADAGPVYVVHFDAHSDTHQWSVPRGSAPGLRNSNVMTFVESLDGVAGLLQIGLRELEVATDPASVGPSAKCTVVAADEITTSADPAGRVFRDLPAGARIYLTIDADVLDPAFAPEVGWPVPGGLTIQQLLLLLRAARARYQIVGLDLVEVMGVEQGVNKAALAMARCALALLTDPVDTRGAEIAVKPADQEGTEGTVGTAGTASAVDGADITGGAGIAVGADHA